MSNGNIEFVKVHQHASRFELVTSPFKPLQSSPAVDDRVAPVVADVPGC
jgi:hypothetical protein